MQSDIFKRKPEEPTDHIHRHYWTENKGNYEPVIVDGEIVFRFNWYAYSACNCGESAKRTAITTPLKEQV